MPRASAADAAATAARILDIATARFAEHGYAAASVDEIAQASGVTRGAVYHHYSSKPGLFAAVASAQQHRIADDIITATAESTPASSLRDGSHAFLDAITRGAAARVLLVDGPSVLSWDDWRRLDAEGPVEQLREGLREAGVAAGLLDALAAALSGAMNELALWLSERAADTAARRRAHEALDRLLDAAIPR
ncbi:TetR/AcrR family transcriptional regulator [Streptomyces sp. AC495_CC817]|uniref:TetR/AcrR family transcriptional regulator n=1 Tax=Streptomyces sp. AC495_CC817 TaxID=2823900 RepID=UPI001C27F4E6|nr:TetR/AcrR family transcriptional regulator [Streptomyces sp. AC495_CC817]